MSISDERLAEIAAHAKTVEERQGPELLLIVTELQSRRAAPAVPDGWVLVPVEPTEAMLASVARLDWTSTTDVTWADGYRAMLAARPTPPKKDEP